MAIIETFAKRKKRLESAGKQDVYQYDEIPHPFRVQVAHIWKSTLGSTNYGIYNERAANGFWRTVRDDLCRELGLFSLADARHPDDQCRKYLLEANTDDALGIIELSFRYIDQKVWLFSVRYSDMTQKPDEAIEELNYRFREHQIGYQYADGILIRIDSQFIHAKVVRSALSLLSERGFEGPAEEFLNAHDHYRRGRTKEAMGEALKAFESTMKAICIARKWMYTPKDTAKALLDILFENGLIPSQLANHFAGLRSALEAGLPTVSNPNRHGQGSTPVDVPLHMVAYALHLCAANIVFLVEAHKAKK